MLINHNFGLSNIVIYTKEELAYLLALLKPNNMKSSVPKAN